MKNWPDELDIISLIFSRFIMRNLNIGERRLVTGEDVDEMIKAVDDGDGLLDYGEFINLIQKH